jgi:ribokinase
MNRSIVVVGSVNLDLVCTGKRIPAPGETLTGDSFQSFHGGKGANQAVAVGRLGYPVSMIAKVGDDDFGKRLRRGLQTAAVNVRGVTVARGTSSGVALISVDRQGQNSITVIPGANASLLPADLDKCLPQLRSAGIILVQLETPIETVEYLCDLARRFDIPVMLDPAPARPLSRKILRQVTYLTPNEAETCALCGIPYRDLNLPTIRECARELLSRGTDNVIIKMGSRGAYLTTADGLRSIVPSFKVKVVDSTAAGDAFNGGMAVALMRGMAIQEAVRFGSAVAAISVTRPGAQPAMPSEDEVNRLLQGGGKKVSAESNGHRPGAVEVLLER